MKTYLFPGQGSQSKGMGDGLFDEFKDMVEQADEVLGYSIKELCLEDPKRLLNKTQYTQPALYVVNALSWFKKVQEVEDKPDYLAGHSLGEYNALMAAGAFDFITGLKIVQKRGELMENVSGGGMAAILNSSKEKIEAILLENNLTGIDLANFNTADQIVISGLRDEVVQSENLFQKQGMHFYLLKTNGAFHSRYMKAVQCEFEAFLSDFRFSDPKIPVIANISAQPYANDSIVSTLSNQISGAVKWYDTVRYLMGKDGMEFEEVGYGNVLTRLVAQIRDFEQRNSSISEQDKQNTVPLKKSIATHSKNVLSVIENVKIWNDKYPVGTQVKSNRIKLGTLKTRSKAVVLFGSRSAVYLEGYNGYFDLNDLSVD